LWRPIRCFIAFNSNPKTVHLSVANVQDCQADRRWAWTSGNSYVSWRKKAKSPLLFSFLKYDIEVRFTLILRPPVAEFDEFVFPWALNNGVVSLFSHEAYPPHR